jgi:hypothetical protein
MIKDYLAMNIKAPATSLLCEYAVRNVVRSAGHLQTYADFPFRELKQPER